MVLGEGAGAVVLEEHATAHARGATIYAEVIGSGSCQVATPNLVGRRAEALAGAMRATLRDAGVGAEDIGHIQAHGLSTTSGDIAEAEAIRAVCGARAETIPVTAAKSYFGNLGAGSGTVELVAGILALRHRRLFPTLNFDTPDPACPLAVVTSADADPGRTFLNLSVTPQGQASCVLVRRWE
jgi:3-oxoacyl-[acyl-carrier-protein] synthase II